MSQQTLELRRGTDVRRAVFAVIDDTALLPFSAAPELMLSAAELAQYAHLRFAQKRQAFMLGRLAAKIALGAMLEESVWPNISIRAGVFGQPLLTHPRALGVDVTVSHSNGMAVAVAFPADWPVGIDLETIASDALTTVLAALDASPQEQAWLAAEPISRPGGWERSEDGARPEGWGALASCGLLWTAREALGKALKTGLNSPLGVLSLCDFKPTDADSSAKSWTGGYANFPQFRWLAQAFGARILTLCLPREIEMVTPPALLMPVR